MAITYEAQCPVHHTRITCKKEDLVTIRKVKDGNIYKRPAFFCASCQRYYVHSPEYEGKEASDSKKEYKGYPYSWACLKYTLISDTLGTSGSIRKANANAVFSGAGRTFTGSKPVASKAGKPNKSSASAVKPLVTEKKIRIHKLDKAEIDSRLQMNYDRIHAVYPLLAKESDSVMDLIKKVFPSNLNQKVVIRNETFMGNNGLIRRVEIYNKNSSYLSHRLPTGVYLSFGGRVSNGEFYVSELRIIENPILKEDDTEVILSFLYDGPNHPNWLYELTASEAKNTQKIEGELGDWNNYLDWKRQLAELRIRGMKYIGFRFDIEAREMTFLVVTEGKDSFEDFRRFLRRNEVSIFSNNYSTDRWIFEFNRDYQDYSNNDSGITLTFTRFGNTYRIDDVDSYAWDGIRDNVKKYRYDDNTSTRSLVGGINRHYFEPVFAELTFELSGNAMTTISRQLRKTGSLSEDIEETLAGEFYGDGYIATSQIGDFALLKRLKQAVQDLASGRCASQGLDQWLFDIKKARVPGKIETIDEWQNSDINEMQKQAVEKILSVPDICLIQGPPGTGKTTVIAEAIYQLVIRNKRVMVASQANLAVDNALERLISNPKIRAIRLGSAKKIDSSVSNITEGNVLETFYDSILSYLRDHYVSSWDKIDAIEAAGKYDFKRFNDLQPEITDIRTKISELNAKILALNTDWDSDKEYAAQNELKVQKINLMLLASFCDGKADSLELLLNKSSLLRLWKAIEPVILGIKKQGLFLTRVGINVDDLETPVRINRANDIIEHVLSNAKVAVGLLAKLNSTDLYGGANQEIEELKIQEEILKERVLKDMNPEDMVKWQEINKKIRELSESGGSLSDKEKSLFDELQLPEDNSEKQAYMISILQTCIPLLQMLNREAIKTAGEISTEITVQQEQFDQRAAEKELYKEQLKQEISALESTLEEKTRLSELVLRKYKATPDTLEARIIKSKENAAQQYKTAVSRNDWEDIFRGLQNWVDEIPDYSQEKEVYLKDFINGCNVVGVSCTENARTLTENGFDDFDVVIIDEVSKATPPELLIPMLRGRKIVLVGDHRQLPPLFNEHEKTYQEVAEQQENQDDVIVQLTMQDFNKYKDMVTASLFEKYFENAASSIKETLIYQYRMHSDIMDIINIFYDNYLKDGNEDNYTYDTKAHYLDIRSTSGTEMIIPDRHAYWFDSSTLDGERIFEQRKQGSTSAENLVEAEMIIELLKKMELQYANKSEVKLPVSVGVISFYYDQVALIRQMLRREKFHAIDVEVNTVDRFQGKEKEIVFVSLVRNVRKSSHNVDSHIAAFQRINVAFSRAQNLLIIVGAKDMYAEQPVKITDMNNGEEKVIMAYKEIIEMLDQRGTYFTSDEVINDLRADEIITALRQRQGGNE